VVDVDPRLAAPDYVAMYGAPHASLPQPVQALLDRKSVV